MRGKNQVDRPETRPTSSSADLQEGQAPSPAPEGAFSRRPGLPRGDAADRQGSPWRETARTRCWHSTPAWILDLLVHIKFTRPGNRGVRQRNMDEKTPIIIIFACW